MTGTRTHALAVGLLIAASSVLACGSLDTASRLQDTDRLVYAAVLREVWNPAWKAPPDEPRLGFVNSTLTGRPPLSGNSLGDRDRGMSTQTAVRQATENLRRRCRRQFALERLPGIPAGCPSVGLSELSPYDSFKARYPTLWGYVRVSSVGYSKDRRFAIVWMQVSWGGSFSNDLYLLSSDGASWKVEDEKHSRLQS